MTDPSVPIIREADLGEMTPLSETWYQVWKATGETTNEVLDTWFEVVPPQIGPPEHTHHHSPKLCQSPRMLGFTDRIDHP